MNPPRAIRRRSRRDFFKRALTLGAAALGSAGAGRRAAAATDWRSVGSSSARYRLTAHIRKYYARASL